MYPLSVEGKRIQSSMAETGTSMWNKYAVVGDITKALSGKTEIGKTKLQKLIFLLSELEDVGVGYEFHFYNYGPYSNGLASDIGYLGEVGALTVRFDSKDGAFHIEPGKEIDSFIKRGQEFLDSRSAALRKVTEKFGEKTAKELELLSTIVYVAKRDPESAKGNEDRLVTVTKALKPKFSERDIRQAADLLKREGYLRPKVV
jgi:uncharacterized protein